MNTAKNNTSQKENAPKKNDTDNVPEPVSDKKKPGQESNLPTKGFYDYYVASIPLFQSLLWPLLLVIILISLQKPLREVMNQLPELVSNSSHISVGGLTLEVEKRLISNAPPELAPVLPDLSKEAISLLLSYGSDYPIWRALEPSDTYSEFIQRYPGLENLRDAQLITIEKRVQEWGADHEEQEMWMWCLSDLGIKTHQYIINTLVEVFAYNYTGISNNISP